MIYNVLQYVFAGLAVVLLLSAVLVKSKRGPLAWAFVSSVAAALAARYHVFWVLSVATLMIPWALICVGDWIDMAWRAKVGLCVVLALGSALAIYPTYVDERYGSPDKNPGLSADQEAAEIENARSGNLGFGRFIRANVPFRLLRGLDLRGGLRLVYSVDVQEAIKDKRDRYFDELRNAFAIMTGITKEGETPTNEHIKTLGERIKVEKSREDVAKLSVVFNDPEDFAKVNEAFLKKFIGELDVLRGADKKSMTFHIKQDVEAHIRDNAVAQAKDKVQRRIDGLGLKEVPASISGENIILEVPGNDERQFEEIMDIISQTARLEFKMLDDDTDFFDPIVKNAKPEELPTGLRFDRENAPVGEGKTKPIYIAVLIKGEHESMRDALTRFKEWTATLNVPDTHQIGYGKQLEYDEDKGVYEEVGWRSYYLQSRAEIVGDMIRDAQARADQGQGGISQWVVSMEFTPIGADRFEEVTGKNIQRRFAIILDERVESAPVIQGKIAGGHGQITMGAGSPQKQLEEAKKLELVLRSGALPAPISLQYRQKIGASLGADAIHQGVKGAALGGGLVLFLMVLVYVRGGMIANIAVLFNLVLQIAILAMFNAAMSLPGLAGLALTIGIAVDANVLINERIRDEIRAGKSARAAVDIGYDKAFSAILDGHVTTFISGVILAQFGNGPIKGFAITLIVGIVASLFTGVVMTRLMFDFAVRWRKVKTLSLG